jgi:uncharacterized protein
MIYFLDASALVKRYVREPGTDVLLALFRRKRSFAAARITEVEVPAALARRTREGDLEKRAARRQSLRIRTDLAGMHVVELRREVARRASELLWEHPLRAYDAVQLASALQLATATGLALTFVCADAALCGVAEAKGVRMLLVG